MMPTTFMRLKLANAVKCEVKRVANRRVFGCPNALSPARPFFPKNSCNKRNKSLTHVDKNAVFAECVEKLSTARMSENQSYAHLKKKNINVLKKFVDQCVCLVKQSLHCLSLTHEDNKSKRGKQPLLSQIDQVHLANEIHKMLEAGIFVTRNMQLIMARNHFNTIIAVT